MMLTAPVSSVPCFQSPTASARYGPWPASRAAAPSGCRSGQWESLRTGRCLLGTACRLPALRFPPGTARCSGLALHFLCSSSGLSHFSKRSVPASERDAEKPTSRRRGQRCTAAPGVSLRLDRPQARARARVSVCAHVHTYACSRIHPHTFKTGSSRHCRSQSNPRTLRQRSPFCIRDVHLRKGGSSSPLCVTHFLTCPILEYV